MQGPGCQQALAALKSPPQAGAAAKGTGMREQVRAGAASHLSSAVCGDRGGGATSWR